jgi:hypothetical protein
MYYISALDLGLSETGQVSMEVELAFLKGLPESSNKLTAEKRRRSTWMGERTDGRATALMHCVSGRVCDTCWESGCRRRREVHNLLAREREWRAPLEASGFILTRCARSGATLLSFGTSGFSKRSQLRDEPKLCRIVGQFCLG